MKVNQSVVANQETKLNQDGKPIELWGEGAYEIPVIVEMDSVDEHGMVSGISRSDLRKKRVCNRAMKVVFVRGTKEQYDVVMSSYSKEFKAEDRDRRCMVSGEDGKLIRCPEQVLDSRTGKMKCNSCKNCPYYYSLDKKEYYTAAFSDLASCSDDDDLEDFEPGTSKSMSDGERYYRILQDLIESVREKDPVLADILRLKEGGMSQSKIGEQVGIDQRRISEMIKAFKPKMDKFLANLLY